MMEEGPQPMKAKRPAKKNPNGADQFRTEHEEGSESDEAQDRRDAIRNVDNHNAAYPKMKDELEKRRSSARVTVPIIDKRRLPNEIFFDPHCRLCQKLKKAIECKKRATRTKPRNERKESSRKESSRKESSRKESSRKESSRKESSRRSRVSKPRNERKKPNMKSRVSKQRKQRNYRSTLKSCKIRNIDIQDGNAGEIPNEDGTVQRTDDQDMNEIYFSNCDNKSCSALSQATTVPESQNGSKWDVTSYPDTSRNSLSSYNSNMDLDHEPMVSP